jgi:hypothetical protein
VEAGQGSAGVERPLNGRQIRRPKARRSVQRLQRLGANPDTLINLRAHLDCRGDADHRELGRGGVPLDLRLRTSCSVDPMKLRTFSQRGRCALASSYVPKESIQPGDR